MFHITECYEDVKECEVDIFALTHYNHIYV